MLSRFSAIALNGWSFDRVPFLEFLLLPMEDDSDADQPKQHKSQGQRQTVHPEKGQHDVDRKGDRATQEKSIAQD